MKPSSGWNRLFWASVVGVCSINVAEAVDIGERYGLIVGISKYEKPMRPITGISQDVIDLGDLMVRLGFRRADVIVMVDSQSSNLQPYKDRILGEMDKLFAKLQKEDLLVVAFAGHMIQYKDETDPYFCPLDAQPNNRSTLIKLSEIYSKLSSCKAERKLALFDVCWPKPFTVGAYKTEVVAQPQGQRAPEDIVALFSCSSGQYSLYAPELGGSNFLRHIISGLREKGDLDRDKRTTFDELINYVRPGVRSYASVKLSGNQVPYLVNKFPHAVVLKYDARLPVVLNAVNIGMLKIPAGEFAMGSPAGDPAVTETEKPQHVVRLTKTFYLSKFEITQEQYERVMNVNPSWFSAKGEGKDAVKSMDTRWLPVERVSWHDAIHFCNRLSKIEQRSLYYEVGPGETPEVKILGGTGYRLPTEAEWEYACRAQTKTPFYFGRNSQQLDLYAWYDLNARKRTRIVGEKLSNDFELHDMYGNVWEWCWDYYQIGYSADGKQEEDPLGPANGSERVVRGGCWNSQKGIIRSATRFEQRPEVRSNVIGFRVARTGDD